jgi:hypothetical protein
LIFISKIYRFNIIYLKKSFYPDEKYGYIKPTKSLAGAAEVHGSTDNIADKEVKVRCWCLTKRHRRMARDGREALPYPTVPVSPNL